MEVYLTRLPRVVDHVGILLTDRGFVGWPHANGKDAVQAALHKKCSIGESLSCVVKSEESGMQLAIVFLDPIFDLAKGKEVMTSSYQVHGAMTTEAAKTDAADFFLMISFSKLSPDASKEVSKLKKKVQVLTFRNLAIPLSRHVLVPKHVALTETEAQLFERERKIDRYKLPHLKQSDPVRIWYGWPKHTVVRIDRPTGVVWRCVH
jgi:DNA-directed RNA polymerase subunit H (RpoH/RPB5)